MQARPMLMLSCGVCVSVRHVHEFCQNISSSFSLSVSHTIWVFPYQTSWRYSDRDSITSYSITSYLCLPYLHLTPQRGVKCR